MAMIGLGSLNDIYNGLAKQLSRQNDREVYDIMLQQSAMNQMQLGLAQQNMYGGQLLQQDGLKYVLTSGKVTAMPTPPEIINLSNRAWLEKRVNEMRVKL